MTTAALAVEVRAAVRVACDTLFASASPPVLVKYSTLEQPEYADDVVLVGGVHAEQEPGALGTSRARDEVLTIDITTASWRPGTDDADQLAYAAAASNLDLIAEEFRSITGDTTLGGLVLWCFLDSFEANGADVKGESVAPGRIWEIIATFKARVRIRG